MAPQARQRGRLPEGILQALYLVGKEPGLELARDTARLYRRLDAADYRQFFAAGGLGEGRARVRANYLMSAFRTDPGRAVDRVLELGRTVGLWQKALPGMEQVVADPVRWRRTVDRVTVAHRRASASGRGGREWVFGALLAELPDEAAARRAISTLRLPERPTPGAPASRAGILAAYRQHRAERDGRLRPVAP